MFKAEKTAVSIKMFSSSFNIFQQYNKQKSHKYGIKLFKVCTNSRYSYKLQVYNGNNFDTVNATPTKVVLSLCEDFLNKGHTIATDNWYTGLDLAYELLQNQMHFLGPWERTGDDCQKKL